MSAIDFKEIPEAHLGGGRQDTFELFARDFLKHLGYEIEVDPSRGADGGVDILVVERRSGVGGETLVRWLVSCKHKAHSGVSVSANVDSNIRDRIEANNCDGFIGFYSTIASSGLADVLSGLSSKFEVQVFDSEKIESYLLKSSDGLHLAKRYFPKSIAAWVVEKPKPANIFTTPPELCCKYCGKNLIEPKLSGIIVVWSRVDPISKKNHYTEIYWCCKGNCDEMLSRRLRVDGCVDDWEDIPNVAIPLIFARWIMSSLNEMNSGHTYSPDAFENLKKFILRVYPFVVRETTQEEKEKIEDMTLIPAYLGGLGY